jgi:hypothetical protein
MAQVTEKPDLTFLKICDRWERARRNPKYISLAEKARFDKKGFLDIVETDKAGINPNVCTECAESFGFQEMIDPSKEFYELFGFVEPPTEDDILSMSEEQFDKTIWAIFMPNYNTTMSTPDGGMPGPLAMKSPDGEYFAIEIDISRSDEEIKSAVLSRVKELRQEMNVKVPKGGETFAKRFNYYEIWDKRAERIPFPDIALSHKKNREEPLEKAIDRVKKRFYRACELITGKRYDSQELRKLLFPDGKIRQEHRLTRSGVLEYSKTSNTLYGDPEVPVLLQDILSAFCEKCTSDSACRDAILRGDLSSWIPCRDVIAFLEE